MLPEGLQGGGRWLGTRDFNLAQAKGKGLNAGGGGEADKKKGSILHRRRRGKGTLHDSQEILKELKISTSGRGELSGNGAHKPIMWWDNFESGKTRRKKNY